MKHETIIVVVLTYVIGFITAYIAFGVNHTDYQEMSEPKHSYSKESKGSNYDSQKEMSTDQTIATEVKSDGLYAMIGGDERILSAQAISATTPGYHYKISVTEVSPSGEFILYCSQLSATDTTCANFIYEISSDLVYLVKDSRKQQVLTELDLVQDSTWSKEGFLVLPTHKSANAEKPWQVI